MPEFFDATKLSGCKMFVPRVPLKSNQRGRRVLEPTAPGLPAWVYKRDGRLVPFEADKISQALFAASEAMGKPDAFLARELTDGILHFLARETGATIPTTAEVAELVIKIVRELGQPGLSQAFADGNRRRLRSSATPAPSAAAPEEGTVLTRVRIADHPAQVVRHCLREYSLHAIYARDLVAAHREGLLTLLGLETPLELAGCIFDLAGRRLDHGSAESRAWAHSRRPGALVQAIQEMRSRAGSFLVIDGPEHVLTPFASAGDLAKNSGELGAGLEATGLAAVINLNCAQSPTWAEEHAEGPLFAEQRRPAPPSHLEEFRAVLLEHLLRPALAGRVRIDWHLGERDFESSEPDARLERLARQALDSPALGFAFDRLQRTPSLAEGIDRKHPAVLQGVGLHLDHLLELPDVGGEPARLLLKLPSLVRMAVSAGVQKRNFLRRRTPAQDPLARGFLLERARLVVVPVGLEATVRALAGNDICAGGQALELAQQIISSLCANLRQAGHAANIDVCADSLCWKAFASAGGVALADVDKNEAWRLPALPEVAGLTAWSPGAEPEAQLRAAGLLHAAADRGTAAILLDEDRLPTSEQLVDLLRFAWKRTDIDRIRFLRVPHQQPQLPW
jgi:hypothetical protein